MKRNLKVILSLLGILISLGLLVGTIIYAKDNLKISNIATLKEMKEKGETQVSPAESGRGVEGVDKTPDIPENRDVPKPMDENGSNWDEVVSSPENINGPDYIDSNGSEIRDVELDSTKEMAYDVMLTAQTASDNKKLTNPYKIVVGASSLFLITDLLYLLSSKFYSKKIFINKDKVTIFLLLTIILTGAITYGIIHFTNNYWLNSNPVDSSVAVKK